MNLIIFYTISVFLTLLIISYTFYIFYLQLIPGAFYYPSVEKDIQSLIKSVKPKSKDIFVDLGSGDGRIIIAAAKMGIKSVGYELNPTLFYKSTKKIKKLHLSHLAKIKLKNFWKIDFNSIDIIYVYQFPKYIKKLEKILNQTNHSITVISYRYPFPHQKPYLIKNQAFFYKFHKYRN
ncbi:MAG: hypothetical protein PHX34_03060 [Candidatus Shapirobacteria bacterium]|nr:hypothetical protein [Candidatus Shapirobacteria bacterium]